MLSLGLDYPSVGVFILLAAVSRLVLLRLWPDPTRSKLPLPPGPRPLSIVGNIREFPLRPERLRELHKKYGK